MSNLTFTDFSNQLADAVTKAASSVVQVHGRRQPASGVVHAAGIVVTTTRAIGREDGITIRTPDNRTLEAELMGWDPATHVAVLRAPELAVPAATVANAQARVGHIGIGVARSWSNSVTASSGIISVIGGPLPTGRGLSLEEIIRTNAPMHRGFAGGAFVDTEGNLIGLATAAEIRGLGVVIPAAIAWKSAASLVEHGRTRRGYLGVAGQAVSLAPARTAGAPTSGVLVVRVMEESPAHQAGLIVGDVLIALDDQPLDSPDRLLTGLFGRGGQSVTFKVLRGGVETPVTIHIGER